MIFIKTKEEIEIMREGGRILASVRNRLAEVAQEGVSLKELDEMAERMIKEAGATPAFLGYKPAGADAAYSASICASLNEVVVHGLPDDRKLKSGDVLKIDLGVLYGGYYTDSAVTVAIGGGSEEARKLIRVTKECLDLAIKECVAGKSVGDIGWVVNNHAVKNGFRPLKGLTGHGIGKDLHEEPSVFNEGRRGGGELLAEGMVLALEPMISVGGADIKQLPDDSYAAKDGSLTAQFEHTVAITKEGTQIITS